VQACSLRACGIEVRSRVLSLGGGVDSGAERSFVSLEESPRGLALRAVDGALEPNDDRRWTPPGRTGETLGGSILVGARGVPAGLGSFALGP
jgi:chorismate synthase